MSADQHAQADAPTVQEIARPRHAAHRPLDLARLRKKTFLTSREAMVFSDRPTLAAWYVWRDRHGIVQDGAGRVARRDIERALDTPRQRRVVHPNSLRALRASRIQKASR